MGPTTPSAIRANAAALAEEVFQRFVHKAGVGIGRTGLPAFDPSRRAQSRSDPLEEQLNELHRDAVDLLETAHRLSRALLDDARAAGESAVRQRPGAPPEIVTIGPCRPGSRARGRLFLHEVGGLDSDGITFQLTDVDSGADDPSSAVRVVLAETCVRVGAGRTVAVPFDVAVPDGARAGVYRSTVTSEDAFGTVEIVVMVAGAADGG